MSVSSAFSALVDTMQIRGASRAAYRNVPVHVLRATVEHERNDQIVYGNSEWPLLPPKLAWQWTEAVFVNKGAP